MVVTPGQWDPGSHGVPGAGSGAGGACSQHRGDPILLPMCPCRCFHTPGFGFPHGSILSLPSAAGTGVDQSLLGLLYSPFFLHFAPLLPRAWLGWERIQIFGGVCVQNEGKDLEFKGEGIK